MKTSIHDSLIVVPAQPPDDETRRRAEKLFGLLQDSKKLGRRQLAEKKSEWNSIYAGVSQAKQLGGHLRVPTGNRGSINQAMRRAVVAAALHSGVLEALPRVGKNVRRQLVPGRKWK